MVYGPTGRAVSEFLIEKFAVEINIFILHKAVNGSKTRWKTQRKTAVKTGGCLWRIVEPPTFIDPEFCNFVPLSFMAAFLRGKY